VTSASPEGAYEALQKYGVDLVAQARVNKLDPVIGRDAEIRRVVRILARKTKNNPVLPRGELHCIGATTLDEYRKHVGRRTRRRSAGSSRFWWMRPRWRTPSPSCASSATSSANWRRGWRAR